MKSIFNDTIRVLFIQQLCEKTHGVAHVTAVT